MSRADPSLCFGQPSPLRCVLLSPAGLASRRGPQFSGKPLLWLSGRGGSDASGSWGAAPSVFWFLLCVQKERPGGEPYRPSPPGDSATPKATTDLLQKSFNSFYLQKSRPRRQARRKLDGEGGRGGWGCGAERRQWRMQRGGASVAVEKIEQASSAKIFSGTARRQGLRLAEEWLRRQAEWV